VICIWLDNGCWLNAAGHFGLAYRLDRAAVDTKCGAVSDCRCLKWVTAHIFSARIWTETITSNTSISCGLA